jgi:hypothetical protein
MSAVGGHFKPNEAGRHTFATHASHRQVEQFALQKFMGHGDPRTIGRYLDLGGSQSEGVLRQTPGREMSDKKSK